jgi:hypothetical protein
MEIQQKDILWKNILWPSWRSKRKRESIKKKKRGSEGRGFHEAGEVWQKDVLKVLRRDWLTVRPIGMSDDEPVDQDVRVAEIMKYDQNKVFCVIWMIRYQIFCFWLLKILKNWRYVMKFKSFSDSTTVPYIGPTLVVSLTRKLPTLQAALEIHLMKEIAVYKSPTLTE